MNQCHECGKPVTKYDYQKVEGYEHRRPQGGGNGLKRRKALGLWMCQGCMIEKELGITPGQEKMPI